MRLLARPFSASRPCLRTDQGASRRRVGACMACALPSVLLPALLLTPWLPSNLALCLADAEQVREREAKVFIVKEREDGEERGQGGGEPRDES